jgi:hypothetical protein
MSSGSRGSRVQIPPLRPSFQWVSYREKQFPPVIRCQSLVEFQRSRASMVGLQT